MAVLPAQHGPWARLLRRRPRPLLRLRERIDAWVLSRVPRTDGPQTIARQRVYILPTRFGYGFAVLLLVMLLGAINYSNSMAFALTFLLGALGLVCMHHTHANLVGMTIHAGACSDSFPDQASRLALRLENASARERVSVVAGWQLGDPQNVGTDLAPRDIAGIELAWTFTRRGEHPLPAFRLWSEYPLGLFRAWTVLALERSCLVYPQPAKEGVPPEYPVSSGGDRLLSRSGADEFAGLRDYRRGDSPRAIHWKSLSRQGPPKVKQFIEHVAQSRWFSYDDLAPADMEARLSLLARWILDADQAGEDYGLRLPGVTLAPARGPAHRRRCLAALARFA